MKKYVLEAEDANGDAFISTYYDEDEAEAIYNEITNDPATICATLTLYYVYGGMCQGDETLKEYNREDPQQ